MSRDARSSFRPKSSPAADGSQGFTKPLRGQASRILLKLLSVATISALPVAVCPFVKFRKKYFNQTLLNVAYLVVHFLIFLPGVFCS